MRCILASSVFLLATLSTQSFAAGFDCSKARTKVEITICTDQALSDLDSDLNRVFNLAQSEHAGVNGETGENIDPVGKEQKAWIRKTRNSCKDADCLRRVYKARIHQIQSDWQVN